MTDTPILVEKNPNSNVITTLFSTNLITATGTVFCMNRGQYDDSVSVAIIPHGNVAVSNSWICYNTVLNYGHSLYLQQIFVGAGDTISVRSQNGTSSFIFTGHRFS
jgi:hypothetical protein